MSVLEKELAALVGAWRLVCGVLTFTDTGEEVAPWGPDPAGRMVLEPGGRIMFLMMGADRAPPGTEAERAALFTTMMAYSGRVRLEGPGRMVTTIDLSWNPAWGGEQVRYVRLEGARLVITTDAFAPPRFPDRKVVGKVVFEREA
jgi:hypothetical protein